MTAHVQSERLRSTQPFKVVLTPTEGSETCEEEEERLQEPEGVENTKETVFGHSRTDTCELKILQQRA